MDTRPHTENHNMISFREKGVHMLHQKKNAAPAPLMPVVQLVYSPQYNIRFFGVESFHPFDAKKYGRAWSLIEEALGDFARESLHSPRQEVSRELLLQVHTEAYLQELRSARYLAHALELVPAAFLPAFLLDRVVLRAMRWATAGTILGAQQALVSGIAVNLGGGFHHAKPDAGEGFCIYSDIGLTVSHLRQTRQLERNQSLLYIDLDAHMGNGVAHVFQGDPSALLFDMYNGHIYPQDDPQASRRIDVNIPLRPRIEDREYIDLLEQRLPAFLDQSAEHSPGLAIYNAGTDVFIGDPLGQMHLTSDAIQHRDLYVVEELRKRGIPVLMVLSGGYTRESHELVARSVVALMERYAAPIRP